MLGSESKPLREIQQTGVLAIDKMNDQQLLQRITLDPHIMVGKPVINGTRLTVEYILNLLAHGATVPEILEEYHGLEHEDILACLR
jgi:uncharacterized protein (DUF433 family)